MRAREFISESTVSGSGSSPHAWTGDAYYRHLVELDDLEEGWKDVAVSAAMGLGALGSGTADAKPAEPISKPAISQPAQQVKTAAPTVDTNAEQVLFKTAKAAGMRGSELAQFLAQIKHETWNFSRLQEKPQPKVKNYFAKKYDPKLAPKTAKILGNKHEGDGEKYHGRGYIQLTGRDNYRMAGNALNIDLLKHPELAGTPEVAAKVALWYWNTRVKPGINNFDDTLAVTKKINNAARGFEDRVANFVDYKKRIKPA